MVREEGMTTDRCCMLTSSSEECGGLPGGGEVGAALDRWGWGRHSRQRTGPGQRLRDVGVWLG